LFMAKVCAILQQKAKSLHDKILYCHNSRKQTNFQFGPYLFEVQT
jgi:hypothetical protein